MYVVQSKHAAVVRNGKLAIPWSASARLATTSVRRYTWISSSTSCDAETNSRCTTTKLQHFYSAGHSWKSAANGEQRACCGTDTATDKSAHVAAGSKPCQRSACQRSAQHLSACYWPRERARHDAVRHAKTCECCRSMARHDTPNERTPARLTNKRPALHLRCI